MTEQPAVFVDTWGWLALGNRRDPRHDEVKDVYHKLIHSQVSLYTSDYVMDELITLLFRREGFGVAVRFIEGILAASVLEQLRIERTTADRFAAAWNLRKQFQDKPKISFTDLVSMAIMNELGIRQVLSDDKHFLQVGMGYLPIP